MQKLLLISLILLLISGCSSNKEIILDEAISVNITEPLTLYGDIPTATHSQTAYFDGRGYILSGSNTLNAGQTSSFLGCTQDKDVHFEDFNVFFSATPFEVNFYRSPTITNNGNSINSNNINGNYPNNSSMFTYSGPTITNNGTLIFKSVAYGGNNIAGATSMPSELILAKNTCYLFTITNNNGNNVQITYNFIWHESK
jgi:uncharacterized protein YcfL